jgi:hypothetical protein
MLRIPASASGDAIPREDCLAPSKTASIRASLWLFGQTERMTRASISAGALRRKGVNIGWT